MIPNYLKSFQAYTRFNSHPILDINFILCMLVEYRSEHFSSTKHKTQRADAEKLRGVAF